ncbi:hypothetical protein [Lactococcus lactis]|uniref:hypothetical protein n=1 Tax=Lactococcus lactis TaxID=1358 RepID=UPI00289063FE|nr:hypothetical protein [Lactococcus lactis]MDT2909283.1 hypothetical protein [Lactococcus lactis]MDT2925187.1 hypothetical protein [Lactococcus lactis]MDT2952046.1 hypothetical protein [Lactococcus lactis]
MSKNRNTRNIGYMISVKDYDQRRNVLVNKYKSAIFYSQIFKISGTDFSEFLTKEDKEFYGDEVTAFLDSSFFNSNIIIGNVPIDLSIQINSWNHKIGTAKHTETAEQARYTRDRIISIAENYNEPSYYIEFFNDNIDAFKNLEYMLHTTERVSLQAVKGKDEYEKIKKSILDPTSNLR